MQSRRGLYDAIEKPDSTTPQVCQQIFVDSAYFHRPSFPWHKRLIDKYEGYRPTKPERELWSIKLQQRIWEILIYCGEELEQKGWLSSSQNLKQRIEIS